MKILFVADLHLQSIPHDKPKEYIEWTYQMYQYSINNIKETIAKENVELLILAGDIFDTVPPKDRELDLFLSLIDVPCRKILLNGNHEKFRNIPKRLYWFDTVKDTLSHLNVEYYDYHELPELDMLLVSHSHLHKIYENKKKYSYIVSHFRSGMGDIADEIDISYLNCNLAILGDIHKRLAYKNIVYCGSPICVNFEETYDNPSCLLLDTNTAEWKWVDTLGNKYHKKVVSYNSLADFKKDSAILHQEYIQQRTYFKAKIHDFAENLKSAKHEAGVLIEPHIKYVDIDTHKELVKEIKFEKGASVKDSFLETAYQNLDRNDLKDLLEIKLAELGF